MDVSIGFLQRFSQIEEVLEELVKAQMTIRQQELLKIPVDAIKTIVPVQRQKLLALALQLSPDTAKAKLNEFYAGVFDEMKEQVQRRITNKVVRTKLPVVIKENAQGMAASGKSKDRPERPRSKACLMGYDLSDKSDGADVQSVVTRLLDQFDKTMQSIEKAVGVLSDLPNNQVQAAFAAESLPEDMEQGVSVIPLERPGLTRDRESEQTKGKELHWDRVKKMALANNALDE